MYISGDLFSHAQDRGSNGRVAMEQMITEAGLHLSWQCQDRMAQPAVVVYLSHRLPLIIQAQVVWVHTKVRPVVWLVIGHGYYT